MQSLDRSQPKFTPSTLGGLLDPARAIRASAERLELESSNHWTQQSTASLSRLSERLVSDLLPCLAATESVLTPHLETDLSDLLRDSHRKIRQLAERLSIVSEAVSRSRGRPGARPVHEALLALRKSLDELESIECAALRRLESSLSEGELARLAESMPTATAEARAHIVLVTQPEPAPTDAYVLRRRPDLDRAYATNLNTIERTSPRPRRPRRPHV